MRRYFGSIVSATPLSSDQVEQAKKNNRGRARLIRWSVIEQINISNTFSFAVIHGTYLDEKKVVLNLTVVIFSA